jgi:hypothetical protein
MKTSVLALSGNLTFSTAEKVKYFSTARLHDEFTNAIHFERQFMSYVAWPLSSGG